MQTCKLFPFSGCLSLKYIGTLLGLSAFASIALASDVDRYRGESRDRWVATWATAIDPPEILPGFSNPGFNNQTLRQIVHTSIGGRHVRVRLSTFGAGALTVGAIHLGLSAGGPAIVPGSDHALTFGGRPSITIPPGAPAVSDAINLDVAPLSDLAITIFVNGVTGPASWNFDSRQTSYISPEGDFTRSTVMPLDPANPTTESWFWISGVDVEGSPESGAVAAIGDSLTVGDQSTVDGNARWTDGLARRLLEQQHRRLGVLNAGLDGNRLLHDILGPNGLARFDRDILSQPGLSYVISLLGTGDIGTGWSGGSNPDQEVSAGEIIQGYRQLIERAHTRGIKILGATLPPFQGAFVPGTSFPLYSAGNEIKRKAVNVWIRTTGSFDGVIDFDRVLRDPDAPARLSDRLDSGDHVHPNDAGYQAMADAIDLRLLHDADCH